MLRVSMPATAELTPPPPTPLTPPTLKAGENGDAAGNGREAIRELGVEGDDERMTGVVGPEIGTSRDVGKIKDDAGNGKEAEGT